MTAISVVPTTSAPRTVCPLADLPPGATATLHDVRVDAECRTVLRGLGLTDACRLRLCKHGEPCIIQVRSTRIGLSRAVSEHVYVVRDQS